MKPIFFTGILALGLALPTPLPAQDKEKPAEAEASETPAPDAAAVKSDSSYALGLRTGGEFGERYGNFGITPDDIEMTRFIEGFLAGFKREDSAVDEEKLAAAMQALGDLLQKRETELAARNLEAGKAFLAANASKEGVTTLKSGLQYEVITAGNGEKYVAPKEGTPDKQFLVNYRGTLIDGTQFDASPEGEPIAMRLEVIDGMKEALKLMDVGAKWRLFIPSELAYADQRRSSAIGPNSVLIFEIELVKIEDAPQHPGGILPGAEQGSGE
ncbi:MAG: FKBP-type peptidyl-prolyl cis-trans isomerase [Akkermansiaceae bacterium]|jgi:FKBP-type peptidyl-prolyl cis-trans isomerase|nr:FKBP-type peptidyl-prolyl cis-trans isomerase [Akkermansiaceae bacterium]